MEGDGKRGVAVGNRNIEKIVISVGDRAGEFEDMMEEQGDKEEGVKMFTAVKLFAAECKSQEWYQ